MSDDWNKVTVIRKNAGKKPQSASGIAAAKRAGTLGTERKAVHGQHNGAGLAVYARKLDDETEDFRHAKISTNFKIELQKARQKKGWTQKQLAAACNLQPAIINTYESGKAVPDPSVINKLNRILGVKLPKIIKPKKDKK
jgi:putative transcription factor